ncbi:hypothetical protein J4216_05865 [Candidatus Woesearchaeota archaeon]|nr:hypothetical protein [Candidatus Woesearchaeota archaeon]
MRKGLNYNGDQSIQYFTIKSNGDIGVYAAENDGEGGQLFYLAYLEEGRLNFEVLNPGTDERTKASRAWINRTAQKSNISKEKALELLAEIDKSPKERVEDRF